MFSYVVGTRLEQPNVTPPSLVRSSTMKVQMRSDFFPGIDMVEISLGPKRPNKTRRFTMTKDNRNYRWSRVVSLQPSIEVPSIIATISAVLVKIAVDASAT